MYMPWVPCIPCANAIIHSWVKTLVMHYLKIIKTPWSRLNDVQDATEWLLKNWIKLVIVNEEIDWCESKLRWEIWNP
jgi:deoxycytidylate deaminase